MNYTKIISNSDLDIHDIDEIILIKSISWPYTYEQHLEWHRNNFKDNDLHLLLYYNDDPVGYLSLSKIQLIINHKIVNCYGIGNVCVRYKGVGLGALLLNELVAYMKIGDKIGILFCKDNLVELYSKFEFKLIKKELVELNHNVILNTMILNYKESVDRLIYSGKLF